VIALRPGIVVLALITLLLPAAKVAAGEPEEHFRQGTKALDEGKFEAAIDQLEAYADRGASHPDASFNRGLAYILRIRSGAERPGDLGRAAAAFEETRLLRPDDGDAEHALELIRAEVARRQARRGKEVVMARPTLDRLLVGLAAERTWGLAAVVASLLLSVGIALRGRKQRPLQLAGTILTPTMALSLLLLLPLYYGARSLRLSTRPGVLVVRETSLLDEHGATLGGEPLPEAALLEVGERKGRLLHVRWGGAEGWIRATTVRLLRTR